MKRKTLFCLSLILSLQSVLAFGACDSLSGGNLEYTLLENDTYSVALKRSDVPFLQRVIRRSVTELEIPAEYNGKPVTVVAGFEACENLISVTLPDSLLEISSNTFNDCRSLESIVVPDSVVTLGDNAFSNCDSLTRVVLGASIVSVGAGTFSDCTALSEILLGESLRTIDTKAFSNCLALESLVLPASLTEIRSAAFQGCGSLTSVVFDEPTGWRSDTEISSVELADDAKAAKYLTEDYLQFDWKRTE